MIRVGFIGTGSIAQTHMKSVQAYADAEIVAVCDTAPDRADGAAKTFGGKAYTDYKEMLDAADLQAVFVCVPQFARGTIEQDAAARGIHMLVEKPLGLKLDDVLRKREAIERAGIIAATGYCLRYSHLVDTVQGWIRDGLRVVQSEAHYWTTAPIWANWYRDIERSGGQVVDQATHVIDLIRYLVGDVEEVHGYYTFKERPPEDYWSVPTASSAVLKFRDGSVGTVNATLLGAEFEAGFHLLGPDGDIHYTYSEARLNKSQTTTLTERSAGDNMYATQANAFLTAIATGDRSLIRSPYADGVKTFALTMAINQSAAEGRPIKVQG